MHRRHCETWKVLAIVSGVALLSIAHASGHANAAARPQSPEAALRSLAASAGFTVELVAAEPLVRDPIAFDWGPDGKLWVVEMIDYPLGVDNKGRPGGRISVLEDTDGDGRYDRSRVFLDRLLHPTGVMAWRRGILVTCAPEIFYAEDTDGDGKADRRDVLFTGFGQVNPQHRLNGLRWGLDNWIYCANGDFAQNRDRSHTPAAAPVAQGTTFDKVDDVQRLVDSGAAILSVKTGALADIRNRDFRIRPDEGLLEPQTGQSQYGRDRDDWGNWFACNHAVPMWHFALDDHYLRRNPHLAAPNPRVEPPRSLTFPRSAVGRETGTARSREGNPFTSACGIAVYRDDLFGPQFAGSWLVCEPVHNLVHREVLVPEGATFSSRRPANEQKTEFLASSDTWFSPVMVRTGPDGALWIADMYRQALEHPNWMPDGWQDRVDVRAGNDRGRIYRVFPAGQKPRSIPRLDRLDTPRLVKALDSPNGWQRDTAQQLLVQRGDKSAIPLLINQATDNPRALCRLHSLCTLDGLDALDSGLLSRALSDRHAGVRRHAVRLCDARLADAPLLGEALLKVVAERDPFVRLQLAYTLGQWDDPRAAQALGELLAHDNNDQFIAAAAISSFTANNIAQVVETVFSKIAGREAPPVDMLENFVRSALGFRNEHASAVVLRKIAAGEDGTYAGWQFAALERLVDILDQRNTSLKKIGDEAGGELQMAVKQLGGLFAAARRALADDAAEHEARLQALRLLGRGPDHQEDDIEALAERLAPQAPPDVQAAAMGALGAIADARVPQIIVRGWKSYGPELRPRALDVLLQREERARALLDAIEHEEIAAAEIDAIRRQRLLDHQSAAIRERAARLLAGTVNSDRQKVVESYQDALSLAPDGKRGAQIFAKSCAACHRLGNVGQAVGPDLATVRDKPPEWFLPAIFDPNKAVETKYVNYVAVTKNGVTLTGVLTNESMNSITLAGPEGKSHVILRGDLDELASSGKSAMPEGFEKDLKPQDVADLIAFLRGK